jgi:hypothetical protein
LELLRHNPSFVFFREVSHVPADRGPLGAMNRSVTDLRTVAVDPAFTPLGAPVWIEKGWRQPDAPPDDCAGYRLGDQGRAAGGYILWHGRYGGACGWDN